MKILGTSRFDKILKKDRGFTLLEMVVVLVLLGVVSSLVVPNLNKMYGSLENSLARDEVISVLNSLALAVRDSGLPLVFSTYSKQQGSTLSSTSSSLSDFPEYIRVQLDELGVSIISKEGGVITASGFCPYNIRLSIKQNNRSYLLDMQSPSCKVRLVR